MPSPNIIILGIAAHVSLAGLLYGLDTGSIGPIIAMTQFHNTIQPLTSTQQGIFTASILISASISSLLTGYIANWLSRRYAILSGGVLSLIGTVISASAFSFAQLIVARLITGVGMGLAISTVTVYLVELAPKEIRGVSACLLQTYVVIGITVGYFISLGTHNISSSLAWRSLFIIQACISLLLTVGMCFMPFSPRWLVQKGRVEEARRVLLRFRKAEEVEDEISEIQGSLEGQESEKSAGMMEMFQKRYLGRSLLGIFLMAAQQLTGIDAVLYYAPILFQQAGFTSERSSFLASGVGGIVMLAATVPAQIWIDRWGRRKPLIYGGSGMVICFFVIGSLYAKFGVKQDGGVLLKSDSAQWVVVVFIYLFVANFSWSWAVVGKIYACEIVPTRIRAQVCAVELLANWLVNFAVALTAPIFLRASPSGPYFLYGAATLVAVAVCVFMPETKGKSLEEIERDFEKTPIHDRERGSEEQQPAVTQVEKA
ncbi:sugar transporter [Delitschia confertaspora ATCC 74209]|uniref:Sugar transporter n=1 Tax=Delitschia confertaspora ATCC 74209 TaxID=1513339 RepID=A0A9P4MS00_9PLEO|nr:sugar transporter [Delitschia confertaspora ATCC 74209]